MQALETATISLWCTSRVEAASIKVPPSNILYCHTMGLQNSIDCWKVSNFFSFPGTWEIFKHHYMPEDECSISDQSSEVLPLLYDETVLVE